ncbi:type III-B CRISPR module RAMP protein Cmr4 [Kutzneria buriramensis]|uniref:CRISPR-associated protein Cmr4 n=1 Tax=Kutzneria buriramensis TaxID=1045776 RepID=A0A3E0HMA1_9PSEU|nr:type III-B CRISPR module RAMP protein Cmr4 [Kutzneria buriramensis]REH47346.1 CRISPR-associated protein Cmr4 [Kutzneria buriramensis]
MAERLLVLLAETPVHAGGSAAEGALDLPIQREAATGLPVIWGQSLKGALRERVRTQAWAAEVFGERLRGPGPQDTAPRTAQPQEKGGELTKGAVSFGDAALLAFPAPTLRNTFAWTTSPLLLSRLSRKLRLLGVDPAPVLGAFTALPPGTYGGTDWAGRSLIGPFTDTITAHTDVATLGRLLAALACPHDAAFAYTRAKLATDLLLLEDGVFTELSKLGTDTVARIQLKEETKTVQNGPFYSEHLPAETVLVSLLSGEENSLQHLKVFDGMPLQLGGDETIGKGLLWCRVLTPKQVGEAITELRAPAQARS